MRAEGSGAKASEEGLGRTAFFRHGLGSLGSTCPSFIGDPELPAVAWANMNTAYGLCRSWGTMYLFLVLAMFRMGSGASVEGFSGQLQTGWINVHIAKSSKNAYLRDKA